MTDNTVSPHGAVRAAVVDDDTVIRDGLALLLTSVQLAGTFSDVEGLLAESPPADVILLDLHLTGTGRVGIIQGSAGIKAAAAAGYRVLVYTNERRLHVLARCIAIGASGISHKAEPVAALEDAIRSVAQGKIVITPALVGLAELAARRGDLRDLSPRQRQVLHARARGEHVRSIADRLYLSSRTVEDYQNKINQRFADFLQTRSWTDLERHLGIGPGDVHEDAG
jgi:two-component system nitrate/nitrite response regulator NarL